MITDTTEPISATPAAEPNATKPATKPARPQRRARVAPKKRKPAKGAAPAKKPHTSHRKGNMSRSKAGTGTKAARILALVRRTGGRPSHN